MKPDPAALQGPGDPSPRDVPGGPPGVLALHGYGGTPLEVELVVDVARELGLRALAPLLPGHGVSARDLARSAWPEWLAAADEALDEVVASSGPSIVVGLSMGSLLAAHLAERRKSDVLALGMLSNAVRLVSPFPSWPLRLFDRLGIRDWNVRKHGADIADPAALATHATFGLQPVNGAIEVLRAGERTLEILPRVTCPAFVAHGLRDHVCPVGNAELVASRLGSSDKTLVILPRSFHISTRDLDRDLLRSELLRFFTRIARSSEVSTGGSGARAADRPSGASPA